jgi:hypothetical protein
VGIGRVEGPWLAALGWLLNRMSGDVFHVGETGIIDPEVAAQCTATPVSLGTRQVGTLFAKQTPTSAPGWLKFFAESGAEMPHHVLREEGDSPAPSAPQLDFHPPCAIRHSTPYPAGLTPH